MLQNILQKNKIVNHQEKKPTTNSQLLTTNIVVVKEFNRKGRKVDAAFAE